MIPVAYFVDKNFFVTLRERWMSSTTPSYPRKSLQNYNKRWLGTGQNRQKETESWLHKNSITSAFLNFTAEISKSCLWKNAVFWTIPVCIIWKHAVFRLKSWSSKPFGYVGKSPPSKFNAGPSLACGGNAACIVIKLLIRSLILRINYSPVSLFLLNNKIL